MPLARLLIDVLLLRRGPQDVPVRANLLYGAMAAYCILLFMQASIVSPLGSALFQAVVSTAALALYARTLLKLRRYPDRAPQTLTALFATGGVFTLLSLGPTVAMAPFILALSEAQSAAAVPQPSPVAALAGVLLACWSIAVAAHIYRHALQTRFWHGVVAALGFQLVLYLVFRLLAPLWL